MRRTIPLLTGLAILGVILNHSNWQILRDIPTGNLVAALPYLIIDQITKFAVPVFVFISGYFIAYATSEGKKELKWDVVRARIEGLLWPWIIWSTVVAAELVYKGDPATLLTYVNSLFNQYYFVPLLLFFYLSSFVVVRAMKANTARALLASLALQLVMVAVYYARLFWPQYFPPWMAPPLDIHILRYLRYAFYFPLGVFAGMYLRLARSWLEPYRRWLPWMILVTYLLQLAEVIYFFMRGPDFFPLGADQTRLTSMLYSFAILFTFMAYERIPLPLTRQINFLGSNSYGLYLSHYAFLGMISYAVRTVFPGIAAHGWLLLPILFALALSSALLFLEIAKRVPIKGFFRFVFG